MKRRGDWHQQVRWLEGLGGILHAQWSDDTDGQSVHSEDAGLYGAPQPYVEAKACKRCVALVRNVINPLGFAGGNQERRGPAGGYRGNSVEQRREAARRLERVAEAAKTHTVTTGLVQSWWPDMTRAAASTFLGRAVKAKVLVRTAPGEYGLPTAKP